ncbi:hypothetical protein [Mucilaginibacter gracilis]|nr:hypothetical protein [Mucilaginibacter gracilis]
MTTNNLENIAAMIILAAANYAKGMQMKEEQLTELLQFQNDLLKEFYVPQIEALEAENKKLRLKLVDRVLQ